jgi:hypothetical protein
MPIISSSIYVDCHSELLNWLESSLAIRELAQKPHAGLIAARGTVGFFAAEHHEECQKAPSDPQSEKKNKKPHG